jgi:hypothetical protein
MELMLATNVWEMSLYEKQVYSKQNLFLLPNIQTVFCKQKVINMPFERSDTQMTS